MWYSSHMKRLVVLPITVLTLITVGSVAYMAYGSKAVKPNSEQTLLPTKQTAHTSPEPITTQPAAPTSAASTTTATATQPTVTTIFQASNTDYPANPAVTPDFAAPASWKISYNYTCNGSQGITVMYRSSNGNIFSFEQHGSAYTVTDIPIADAMTGHFRLTYPDTETCTWSLSVTN